MCIYMYVCIYVCVCVYMRDKISQPMTQTHRGCANSKQTLDVIQTAMFPFIFKHNFFYFSSSSGWGRDEP